LSLSGEATYHSHGDDIDRSIFLEFYSSAFNGGASDVANTTYELSLDFRDPDQVIGSDFPDITLDSQDTFQSERIYIDGLANNYKINSYTPYFYYEGDRDLKINAWRKPLVGEPNSFNISYLQYNEEIGSSSNWETGYDVDELYPTLRNDSYTDWEGREGYVGIVAFDQHYRRYYGWIRVYVSSTGSYFTTYELAYNTKPYQSIYAGTTDTGGTTSPLNASFTANATTIAPGESVSFSDQSSGNPTDWYWEFEGGNPSTSTSQNPTVTYSIAGDYNVSLTVYSGNDSDVQTQNSFITVSPDGGGGDYCSASGGGTYEWISFVEVGSFSNTSSDNGGGYSDFTNQTINLAPNENASITLSPGYSATDYGQHFVVWIDYNQDGDFEDSNELIFQASDVNSEISGSFTVPSSASAGGSRMRISMKGDGNAPTSCEVFGYGEVEDYTVNIGGDGGTPLQADFSASATSINVGGSVSFTDQSSGNPTDWSWEFEGGSPSTSTSANPTVTYNTAGDYNVTLTVSNNEGSDAQTYTNYISVSADGGVGEYCEPSIERGTGNYVSNVEVGGFSHSSSGDNYSHYTGSSISLTLGQSTDLSIETYARRSSETYIKVWIDYDQDGNFESSELIYEDNFTSPQSLSATFTPSTNAVQGETRMRISLASRTEQSDACVNISSGEVEDYTVNIGDGVVVPPGDYCVVSGGGSTEWISRVEVGNFTNTSTSNNGGYSDFTSQTINLNANSNTTIGLTPDYSGTQYNQHFVVWIDYNQDDDFEDANELIFQNSGVTAETTGSFSVPSSAVNGATRMRISMKGDGNSPDPCESFNYGEIEDYTVNISGGAAGAAGTSAASQSENDNGLSQSQITLAPNPVTNGVLTVKAKMEQGAISSLKVINNLGRLVYEQSVNLQGEDKALLQLSHLPTGLYYLQTIGESGISVHKFLIQ